ncbi:hypothetical protein NL676_023823 [Syzygium grande]|nr:hypothetical protein NL676_023823 [Syzygium grande]
MGGKAGNQLQDDRAVVNGQEHGVMGRTDEMSEDFVRQTDHEADPAPFSGGGQPRASDELSSASSGTMVRRGWPIRDGLTGSWVMYDAAHAIVNFVVVSEGTVLIADGAGRHQVLRHPVVESVDDEMVAQVHQCFVIARVSYRLVTGLKIRQITRADEGRFPTRGTDAWTAPVKAVEPTDCGAELVPDGCRVPSGWLSKVTAEASPTEEEGTVREASRGTPSVLGSCGRRLFGSLGVSAILFCRWSLDMDRWWAEQVGVVSRDRRAVMDLCLVPSSGGFYSDHAVGVPASLTARRRSRCAVVGCSVRSELPVAVIFDAVFGEVTPVKSWCSVGGSGLSWMAAVCYLQTAVLDVISNIAREVNCWTSDRVYVCFLWCGLTAFRALTGGWLGGWWPGGHREERATSSSEVEWDGEMAGLMEVLFISSFWSVMDRLNWVRSVFDRVFQLSWHGTRDWCSFRWALRLFMIDRLLSQSVLYCSEVVHKGTGVNARGFEVSCGAFLQTGRGEEEDLIRVGSGLCRCEACQATRSDRCRQKPGLALPMAGLAGGRDCDREWRTTLLFLNSSWSAQLDGENVW